MVRLNQSYGLETPISNDYPLPVISRRAPTVNDRNYIAGQLWLDQENSQFYLLGSVNAASANWLPTGRDALQSGSAASPTTTLTLNARVGRATFTGFTTASAASEEFTINNSFATAGMAILATVNNTGNGAMGLDSIETGTAGTMIINTTNNAGVPLSGDIVITWWIL